MITGGCRGLCSTRGSLFAGESRPAGTRASSGSLQEAQQQRYVCLLSVCLSVFLCLSLSLVVCIHGCMYVCMYKWLSGRALIRPPFVPKDSPIPLCLPPPPSPFPSLHLCFPTRSPAAWPSPHLALPSAEMSDERTGKKVFT